jgi:hypothetical protein
MLEMLDNSQGQSKIPDNRAPEWPETNDDLAPPVNTTHAHTLSDAMDKPCRHPRVQVVSRDEDAEYVECLECREIFESSEFRDMDIEAEIPAEEEE